MMNLRRFFNLPSKFQQSLVNDDIQSILLKCDAIATAEYNDQKEAQRSHDSVCPNCEARKENIVNKIRNVHGEGKVNGSFRLGYGTVNGSMAINTDEVNHCNACGNEWKKYKLIYISKTDILRVALRYLAAIIDDPTEKRYSFKVETIGVFDDCYAESILRLIEENERNITSNIQKTLTLRCLRKFYMSVYDKSSRKSHKN